MMAKIEDVFQIIRERNFKNGTDNRYNNKKSDRRPNDIKKKSRSDNKEKYQKVEKVEKKGNRRTRSRTPRHRFSDRLHRDRGNKVQKDQSKYHKNERHDNKFTRGGKRNQSRDKEYSNKKKKDKRRSTSSSSGNHKNKKKAKNGNNCLSPEVKD